MPVVRWRFLNPSPDRVAATRGAVLSTRFYQCRLASVGSVPYGVAVPQPVTRSCQASALAQQQPFIRHEPLDHCRSAQGLDCPVAQLAGPTLGLRAESSVARRSLGLAYFRSSTSPPQGHLLWALKKAKARAIRFPIGRPFFMSCPGARRNPTSGVADHHLCMGRGTQTDPRLCRVRPSPPHCYRGGSIRRARNPSGHASSGVSGLGINLNDKFEPIDADGLSFRTRSSGSAEPEAGSPPDFLAGTSGAIRLGLLGLGHLRSYPPPSKSSATSPIRLVTRSEMTRWSAGRRVEAVN